MNNLFLVDLEPIEKRYTKQWREWIPREFQKLGGFRIVEIRGNSKIDVINKGRFLDICKTNKYKAQQVERISELFDNDVVEDGDIFLFYDGWHFGITALKYMADLLKKKIKIFSIWHAGSYDKWDFTAQSGLNKWAGEQEKSWFKANDGIFVATQYHKSLIMKKRGVPENKIFVTGLPLYVCELAKEYDLINKENLVVFPHRKDLEKQPKVFEKLKKQLESYGIKCIFTMDETTTKNEYYSLLAKSKVVFSANLQETWGIGTLEACAFRNLPVIPNRLSYKEIYPKKFRYDTFNESKKLIIKSVLKYDDFETDIDKLQLIPKQYELSILRMHKILMNGGN
jgi:hypothetical protein